MHFSFSGGTFIAYALERHDMLIKHCLIDQSDFTALKTNHHIAWLIDHENTRAQNWSVDSLNASVCLYISLIPFCSHLFKSKPV